MKKAFFTLLFTGMSICLALSTDAGSATSTIRVNMTVQAAGALEVTPLDFGKVNSLDFGSVLPGQVAPTATSTITVTATRGTTYSISLDQGLHPAGLYRQMFNGPDFIGYTIYQDPDRGMLWGNGPTFGPAVTGTGTGTPQTYTAYGMVNGGTIPFNIHEGAYSDTITVTLVY